MKSVVQSESTTKFILQQSLYLCFLFCFTSAGEQQESRVFVYHDWGVAVYEPDECRLFHVIQGTDVIPGTQEYVCGDKGRSLGFLYMNRKLMFMLSMLHFCRLKNQKI